MRVALHTTFAASKKEPLATLLERIHSAFKDAGLDAPSLRFSFSDAPLPGFVSSVDRVLKRYPQLARFVTDAPSLPGGPSVHRIAGEGLDFATLLAIATGVPKSFPFHNLTIQLGSPAFGEGTPLLSPAIRLMAGITVGDSWWVNGRVRSLSALTLVEGDPTSKKLPPMPGPVAAVFAACGKAKTTAQVPLAGDPSSPTPEPARPDPEVARAVGEIVRDYRSRFAEIVDRAALPHDLPSAIEAMQTTPLGQTTGPKKPVLVRAFKPMGYDCEGGSGTFTLRRRTLGALTVEISLDVGTWSRSLTAFFKVQGLGFGATLPLPPSKNAMTSQQYPIGNAERWQQLVDNMAALVAELDRSFVPAVEAASGPSPEWYKPES